MGGVSEENTTQNQPNVEPQSTNTESQPQETKNEAPVKIHPLYISAIDRVSFERITNDQNVLQAVVLFGITCDVHVEPSAIVAQIQYRLPNPQQPAIRLIDVDLGVHEIQNLETEKSLVRQQFCICVPLDDPNLKIAQPPPVVHYTLLFKGTTDPKANSLRSVPIRTSESPQPPAFNTFKVQFKLTNNNNNNNTNQTTTDAFPTTVKDLITTCDRAADSVATEVENVLQSAAKVFDKIPGIASTWLNRFEKFMDELDKDIKGSNTAQNTQPVNPPSNVQTQSNFVPIQPQPLNPYGQYYQPGVKPVERQSQVQTQSESPKVQPTQNDTNQNSAFSISD